MMGVESEELFSQKSHPSPKNLNAVSSYRPRHYIFELPSNYMDIDMDIEASISKPNSSIAGMDRDIDVSVRTRSFRLALRFLLIPRLARLRPHSFSDSLIAHLYLPILSRSAATWVEEMAAAKSVMIAAADFIFSIRVNLAENRGIYCLLRRWAKVTYSISFSWKSETIKKDESPVAIISSRLHQKIVILFNTRLACFSLNGFTGRTCRKFSLCIWKNKIVRMMFSLFSQGCSRRGEVCVCVWMNELQLRLMCGCVVAGKIQIWMIGFGDGEMPTSSQKSVEMAIQRLNEI